MGHAATFDECAHGVWRIGTSPGKKIVYCYLIDTNDGMALFDVGIKGTGGHVQALLKKLGRSTADIRTIIVSHSHQGHIGALAELAEVSGATVIAHAQAQNWLLDHERQFLERFGQYKKFIKLPVELHRRFFAQLGRPWLADQWLTSFPSSLPHARNMQLISLPGHSADSIALWLPDEQILLSGDAFSGAGLANNLPGYADLQAYRASLEEISRRKPVVLLSAHFDVLKGDHIEPALHQARRISDQLEEFIKAALEKARNGLTLDFLTQMVCARFGRLYTPQAFTTVLAHLRAAEQQLRAYQQENAWHAGRPSLTKLPIVSTATRSFSN